MLVDVEKLQSLASYAKKHKIDRQTVYAWSRNKDLANKKGVAFVEIDGTIFIYDNLIPLKPSKTNKKA